MSFHDPAHPERQMHLSSGFDFADSNTYDVPVSYYDPPASAYRTRRMSLLAGQSETCVERWVVTVMFGSHWCGSGTADTCTERVLSGPERGQGTETSTANGRGGCRRGGAEPGV